MSPPSHYETGENICLASWPLSPWPLMKRQMLCWEKAGQSIRLALLWFSSLWVYNHYNQILIIFKVQYMPLCPMKERKALISFSAFSCHSQPTFAFFHHATCESINKRHGSIKNFNFLPLLSSEISETQIPDVLIALWCLQIDFLLCLCRFSLCSLMKERLFGYKLLIIAGRGPRQWEQLYSGYSLEV